MKKSKHWRQKNHLARTKKRKINRDRRLAASDRIRIIEPETVDEMKEKLREETAKKFSQAFPAMILGIAERQRQRRYELHRKTM